MGKHSLSQKSHRQILLTSLLSAFSTTFPHMIVCTAHAHIQKSGRFPLNDWISRRVRIYPGDLVTLVVVACSSPVCLARALPSFLTSAMAVWCRAPGSLLPNGEKQWLGGGRLNWTCQAFSGWQQREHGLEWRQIQWQQSLVVGWSLWHLLLHPFHLQTGVYILRYFSILLTVSDIC